MEGSRWASEGPCVDHAGSGKTDAGGGVIPRERPAGHHVRVDPSTARSSATPPWGLAALLAAMLAGLGCVAGDEPAASEPAAEVPSLALAEEELEETGEVRDGAWLYERNCSGCHGLTGAGDGPTSIALGVQARSFAQGGFSFGNTREAILRTLHSGIPGRSVMPPFEGVLSEAELGLVIDHLFTLMPTRDEEDTRASVLTVGSRSVIARGKLPPIAEGLPEHPRGLLVGLPAGLTFEYDVEDVRLLAVRLGDFADREDWRDRGGGYLRPLGNLIQGLDSVECRLAFGWRGRHDTRPLPARLRSTWTGDHDAGLEYTIVEQGRAGSVVERIGCVTTSAGPAFSRRFSLGPSEFDYPVVISLHPLGCAPRQSWWRRVAHSQDRNGYVSMGADGSILLVVVRGDAEVLTTGSMFPMVLHIRLAPIEARTVDVTALIVELLSEERLVELVDELAR